MPSNFNAPLSRDQIKIGYVDPQLGYVDGVSICEANAYAQKNPGTIFIVQSNRGDIDFLNINEINNLNVDILVTDTTNCAGIQTYGSIVDTTEEVWDKTFNVNVKSLFLTSKHVAPTMIKQKSGSIVNISSVQAIVSQKTVVAYSASKGAINSLTRASAIDLAESNVRVNAIMPGSVDTPMLRASAEMHRGEQSVEEVLKDWGRGHPLGRIAKNTEIGDLAVFLVSDHSTFITGSTITIDGGLTVQVPVVLPGK